LSRAPTARRRASRLGRSCSTPSSSHSKPAARRCSARYSWAGRSLPGGLTVLKRISWRRSSCASTATSAAGAAELMRPWDPRSSRRSYADLCYLLAAQRKVAGGARACPLVLERRLPGRAELLCLGAARVEAARRGRVDGARHV